MAGTVVVGVVLGCVAAAALRRRSRRSAERVAQRDEQLAAIVLYTEVTAAIAALDLALRDQDSKWLVSMSESTMLAEAWREHAGALTGLETHQWDLMTAAIAAITPGYRLGVRMRHDELRESLADRRRLLVECAAMLRDVHGGPMPAPPPSRSGRRVPLLV